MTDDRLTPEQERHCLNYDPFDGGEDKADILDDVFVLAGKRHEHGCGICLSTIEKGARHRVMTTKDDYAGMARVRICPECCRAIADYSRDSRDPEYEEALIARWNLSSHFEGTS